MKIDTYMINDNVNRIIKQQFKIVFKKKTNKNFLLFAFIRW